MNKIERDRNRANEKRRILDIYKVNKGCIDCGYSLNADALEFDHILGTKLRTVSAMCYSAWPRVWAEIAKCEIRCANCHAIITKQRLRV